MADRNVSAQGGRLAGMDTTGVEGLRERAEQLRETLRLIDAGEVTATSTERAHIAGSLAALEELHAEQ